MNSKKLLIVEDQHDARFYYRKVLASEGYDVTLARDGKEALSLKMNFSISLLPIGSCPL